MTIIHLFILRNRRENDGLKLIAHVLVHIGDYLLIQVESKRGEPNVYQMQLGYSGGGVEKGERRDCCSREQIQAGVEASTVAKLYEDSQLIPLGDYGFT